MAVWSQDIPMKKEDGDFLPSTHDFGTWHPSHVPTKPSSLNLRGTYSRLRLVYIAFHCKWCVTHFYQASISEGNYSVIIIIIIDALYHLLKFTFFYIVETTLYFGYFYHWSSECIFMYTFLFWSLTCLHVLWL